MTTPSRPSTSKPPPAQRSAAAPHCGAWRSAMSWSRRPPSRPGPRWIPHWWSRTNWSRATPLDPTTVPKYGTSPPMLTAMPCVRTFGDGAGDYYSIASRQLKQQPLPPEVLPGPAPSAAGRYVPAYGIPHDRSGPFVVERTPLCWPGCAPNDATYIHDLPPARSRTGCGSDRRVADGGPDAAAAHARAAGAISIQKS
jgi:hypothetical protein